MKMHYLILGAALVAGFGAPGRGIAHAEGIPEAQRQTAPRGRAAGSRQLPSGTGARRCLSSRSALRARGG